MEQKAAKKIKEIEKLQQKCRDLAAVLDEAKLTKKLPKRTFK